jgi:hypothetical protein
MLKLTFSLLFSFAFLFSNSQPIIQANFGDHMYMDGIAYGLEYQNVDTIDIFNNSGDSTEFRIMYDLDNLYIAAIGNLESKNLFPEVLISSKWDNSTSWESGEDWFFHVSATDCESSVQYGDFNNCDTVQPDWIGIPNFEPGQPFTEVVEIAIPFSKIGYQLSSSDTIAICLMTTNTFNQFNYFPKQSSYNNPTTWAKLVLESAGTSNTELNYRSKKIFLYPNPAENLISLSNFEVNTKYFITDILGREINSGFLDNRGEINVASLKSGVYLLNVEGEKMQVEKFIKK